MTPQSLIKDLEAISKSKYFITDVARYSDSTEQHSFELRSQHVLNGPLIVSWCDSLEEIYKQAYKKLKTITPCFGLDFDLPSSTLLHPEKALAIESEV